MQPRPHPKHKISDYLIDPYQLTEDVAAENTLTWQLALEYSIAKWVIVVLIGFQYLSCALCKRREQDKSMGCGPCPTRCDRHSLYDTWLVTEKEDKKKAALAELKHLISLRPVVARQRT